MNEVTFNFQDILDLNHIIKLQSPATRGTHLSSFPVIWAFPAEADAASHSSNLNAVDYDFQCPLRREEERKRKLHGELPQVRK